VIGIVCCKRQGLAAVKSVYQTGYRAKANAREPKTYLGQVFNHKLGCFEDVYETHECEHTPTRIVENSAQVVSHVRLSPTFYPSKSAHIPALTIYSNKFYWQASVSTEKWIDKRWTSSRLQLTYIIQEC
jgi:hypothetical protein